jgi:hypothetical protein
MTIRKVYIETSVLSRLTDYQRSGHMRLRKAEVDALEQLAQRPELAFVTSSKTLEEFLKAADREHRIALQFLYSFLDKVQVEAYSFLPGAVFRALPGGRGGSIHVAGPAWVSNPLLARIASVFDLDDAEHIYQAIRGSCAFLLTVDFETILDRVDSQPDVVRAFCGNMTIVSPVRLLSSLVDE